MHVPVGGRSFAQAPRAPVDSQTDSVHEEIDDDQDDGGDAEQPTQYVLAHDVLLKMRASG